MSVDAVLSRRAKWHTLVGDVRETLRGVPDGCAQTGVTSPPYYGLRDYGAAGQIGQEQSPAEYVAAMVAVMREVRRVLADDGTLWLNVGDSYSSGSGGDKNVGTVTQGAGYVQKAAKRAQFGAKPKDLLGIPWRLAFALQDDGWYLRSDIIWAKPNPMPESVTDRPTRAHEYVFLLTKRARYFYDADAIKEPSVMKPQNRLTARAEHPKGDTGRSMHLRPEGGTSYNSRNARSVWNVPTDSFGGAHFATMPPELARRCILAGSRRGDVVLDPFGGAGTTALAALQHGRRALLCELNPEYVEIQRRRLADFAADTTSPIDARGADFGPLFGGAR